MVASRLVHRLGKRQIQVAILGLCGVAVLVGAIYLYTQQHVYRVTVKAGQSVLLKIQVPMQRAGQHKSYAKQRRLPVQCTIYPNDLADGIVVNVIETGHKVHLMWAQLRVTTITQTPQGLRKRSAAFEIDGQGGWPTATVMIKVTH